MSNVKTAKVLNRRIKISKTGRPYVDVADLVRTRFERIDRLQHKDARYIERGDKKIGTNGTKKQ
jgi:hypothetical protein